MADVTGKTPGKGIFGSLGLGRLFGGPKPPAQLVGEPAELKAQRLFAESLAALDQDQRRQYAEFIRPMYQASPDAPTDYKNQITLPAAEVAYSTDHGKKTNNEDGVYADPLRGIGVVVDGMSHGGNGRIATEAALKTFQRYSEQPEVVEAELRSRKIKNTPENRIKFIGHQVHEAIRSALGEKEGGVVLSGTLIEDNKLYSFGLGDAINMVIRHDRVVFCSRPTSRLQRFTEIYQVAPKDLRSRLDQYLGSTPVEKIRSEMGYPKNVDLETIKRTIWSDPIKVLGFDDVDLPVEVFDLQPDDTIISVTDGILDPLGLRVIPTKKNKDGQWKFDPNYPNIQLYGLFHDPLFTLGAMGSRTAVGIRDQVLALANGTDHRTILVRRQPLPPEPIDPDPERTEFTQFTPTGPSGSSALPRIEAGYENETTPVDEARRNLPRPAAVEPPVGRPVPPPPPAEEPKGPRVSVRAPKPGDASRPVVGPASPLSYPVLESSEPTGPLRVIVGESRPGAPQPAGEPEPTGPLRVFVGPKPPAVPDRPVAAVPPPLPPGVRPPSPPFPDFLPPLPRVDDETRRRDITRLKLRLRELALQEFDARHTAKDEQAADILLAEIWDMQDRLAGLEGTPRPVRNPAEKLRLRKSLLRHEIALYDQDRPEFEAGYAKHIQNRDWDYAASVLLHDLHLGRIQQVEKSILLAGLEGRFDLLQNRVFILRDERGQTRLQVAQVYPPTDPETPNLVVMNVLDADNRVGKRIALTAQEWQRRFAKDAVVALDPKETVFEASDLIRDVKKAVELIRLWFRAGNISRKLDQGGFKGTAHEAQYRHLRELLEKFTPDYTPPSKHEDVQIYSRWAADLERIQKNIQDLTNPRI